MKPWLWLALCAIVSVLVACPGCAREEPQEQQEAQRVQQVEQEELQHEKERSHAMFEEDIITTSFGDLKLAFVGHGTLMFTFGGKV